MCLYEQLCIKWACCSGRCGTEPVPVPDRVLSLVWTGSANYPERIWPSSWDYQAPAGRDQQHTCEYPKGVEGEVSIRHLLKIAAVNYLGTLVYEVSLECVKASNYKGHFWVFFSSSLISTEFNFTFPLTFRMQKLSFSFFIPSFPFIRSSECWNHRNIYSSMLIFVTFYYPIYLVNPGTVPIWCLSLSAIICTSTWWGTCFF